MTNTTNKQDALSSASTGKRAYIKPAFRNETVFETMALACGKIATTQNACRAHRKAS